jgi:hypothetical protein
MGNYNDDNMLEKYYTPASLMEYLSSEVLEKFYDVSQVTEFLESSAGDGRMVDFLEQKYGKPIIAFDIKNETHNEKIKECDYLKEKIEYMPGRVAFLNPPFAKGIKFVYKALEECDYCVAIMGVCSWLNFDYDKYEVDTIDLMKKVDFGNCKTDISIVGIRKKID